MISVRFSFKAAELSSFVRGCSKSNFLSDVLRRRYCKAALLFRLGVFAG